ncbi:MAG: hypothetical protein IAE91_02320 [Ignavibacteriaceae bacterium]|nr:hypothetical protein [Ignavibacteriaceae bacterium]
MSKTVYILSYPLIATMGDEIKLTNGVISSKSGLQGDITNYKISAPVQPGNIHATLFDSKGNVIGIISSKHTGAKCCLRFINSIYKKYDSTIRGNIKLSELNTISSEDLPAEIKKVKNFVYIIECK